VHQLTGRSGRASFPDELPWCLIGKLCIHNIAMLLNDCCWSYMIVAGILTIAESKYNNEIIPDYVLIIVNGSLNDFEFFE
jgi:hypothetical protein